MFPRVHAIAVVILVSLASSAWSAQLRYLVTLPLSDSNRTAPNGRASKEISQHLLLSVTDVNNQLARPAGHSVFIDVRDTSSLSTGATHIFNSTLPALIPNTTTTTNGSIAMITGITSDTAIPLTLLAQAHGMYVCSGSATATKLSAQPLFGRSFFRTLPADDIQGIALAHYLAHQQWTACAVIASNSKYGQSIAKAFAATAAQLAIDVTSTEFVSFSTPGLTPSAKSSLLARTVNATAQVGVRVVVFFGTMPEYLDLAPAARQAGILGTPSWVWIASEAVGEITLAVDRDPKLWAVTDGLQIVFPEEIVDKQMEQNLLGRAQRTNRALRGETALEPYAGFYRDCLFGLTAMFVDMLKPGSSGIREADVLGRRANVPVRRALRPFTGITGKVVFDAEGRRMSAFNVLSMFGGNATVAYRVDTSGVDGGGNKVTELAKPRYFGGSLVRPPARPEDIVQFVRYRSVSGVFVVGVTGLLGMVVVWWTALLVRNWKHPVVKEHKLSVLVCVAVGVLMILGGTLGWMDVQSARTCNGTKWAISMGFQLIVIPLLYRSYLFWSAFENPRLWSPQPTPTVAAAFACLSVVSPLILAARTLIAPLKPVPFSTLTSFSFKCRSDDMFLFYTFNYAFTTWNMWLYCALLYFSFALRTLRRPGNASSCTHLGLVNFGLTILAISPLSLLRLPGFALGNYWTHVVAVWYACVVLVTMTHGRLVQMIARSGETVGDKSAAGMEAASDMLATVVALNASSSRLPGTAATTAAQLGLGPSRDLGSLHRQLSLPRLIPTSVNSSSSSSPCLARVEAKPYSFIGEFPIKYCSGIRSRNYLPLVPFLSTWHIRRVFITFEDGFFGIHCTGRKHGTTGRIWVLNSISVRRSARLDKVVQVYAYDRMVAEVQCAREEHVWEWIRMFPRRVRWDEKGKVGEQTSRYDDEQSFYGQVQL